MGRQRYTSAVEEAQGPLGARLTPDGGAAEPPSGQLPLARAFDAGSVVQA